jgi:hypothetical protein
MKFECLLVAFVAVLVIAEAGAVHAFATRVFAPLLAVLGG